MASARVPAVREYRLALSVDFEQRRFTGEVEVDYDGLDGPLVLNASGLEISDVRSGSEPRPHELRPTEEELEIRGLPAGTGTVRIAFSGRATDKGLVGLYESRYGSDWILTTQSAPIGARQIFPCLDRPDRKAPIRFTLEMPADLTAIFNTPPTAERRHGERKTIDFGATPSMPTYLFYLGIGRFDRLDGPRERVQVSVFAPAGRAATGAIAIDYARRFLAEFERYFGIAYPLPKLDLIAVPQYAYGAMENWGAIVFRDMYLLFDAATMTRIRRYGLDTIAHEIAHQWFGNLVTMEWWDDIWLNESFATFLEMRIFERVDPKAGSLENYVVYWVPRALEGDALPHTHPVTTKVDHPSQIAQVFDEISYGKGSAVLRMIEAYLGEEGFRRGVARFLDEHRYGNATSRDLWNALDHEGPQPVRPLLEEWTERPGHPILSVRRVGDDLELAQQRFALDGQHTPEHWTVPLTYEVDGVTHRTQLRSAVGRVTIPPSASYHLNPGAVGFYRVRYDEAGYQQLRSAGRRRRAIDRWNVLQDLEAFLYSGDASFDRFAEFVAAEQDAPDHMPVRLIADSLLDLWLVLGPEGLRRVGGETFLHRQFDRLGVRRRPGEPETDGILRERVASALAWSDPAYASRLTEVYPDLAASEGDLRGPVTTAAARGGDAATYERILKTLESAAAEGTAVDYEIALASFPDPSLAERTLDLLTRRTLNRAHLPEIVRRLAWNPDGREPLWAWMQRDFPTIAEETKGTGFAGYVLEYAAPYVGLAHESELRRWIQEHPVAEGGRGAKKGLGLLGANLALRRRFSGGRTT